MLLFSFLLTISLGDPTHDEPATRSYAVTLKNMGLQITLTPEDGGEPMVSTYGMGWSTSIDNPFTERKPDKQSFKMNFRTRVTDEPIKLRAGKNLGTEFEVHLSHRETDAEVGVLFIDVHQRKVMLGTFRRQRIAIEEVTRDENGDYLPLIRHRLYPIRTTGIFTIQSGDEWLGEIRLARRGFRVELVEDPNGLPYGDLINAVLMFPLIKRIVGQRK